MQVIRSRLTQELESVWKPKCFQLSKPMIWTRNFKIVSRNWKYALLMLNIRANEAGPWRHNCRAVWALNRTKKPIEVPATAALDEERSQRTSNRDTLQNCQVSAYSIIRKTSMVNGGGYLLKKLISRCWKSHEKHAVWQKSTKEVADHYGRIHQAEIRQRCSTRLLRV